MAWIGNFLMTYRVDETPHGSQLVLQGKWTSKTAEFMLEHDIKALELNEAKGWKDEDVSFLAQIPWLERLELIPWALSDVSPVSSLTKLRRLNISMRWKKPVDLSN